MSMDRRTFFKGAAAVGATAVTASLIACSNEGANEASGGGCGG